MGTRMRRKRTERPLTPIRPAPPITLVVRPEVIRSIAAASGSSAQRETGEPLIGTVQPSWEHGAGRLIVAILGTIPPGPQLRAGLASVGLGSAGDGERASSALRWWRKVTGLDLRHLGDWHKHPGGSPQPSQGDRATARRMRIESGVAVWLSAIAVCERARGENFAAKGRSVSFSDGRETRGEVCFYRETDRFGLAPVVAHIEEDAIPCLPELPWHITDPVRFSAECRLLRAGGFAVAVEASITESDAGLALRLTPSTGTPLVVVTGARYPFEAPVLLDPRGRKTSVGNGWTPAHFLVDVVKEVG